MAYASTSPVLVATGSGGSASAPDSQPHLTPDGSGVLFLGGATGTTGVELYLKSLATDAVTLVSSTATGTAAVNSVGLTLSATGPIASGDGTQVVFSTDASNLGAGGYTNTFVKNLTTGVLTLVSTGAGGAAAGGAVAAFSPLAGDNRIVFGSTGALTGPAADGRQHTFIKDLGTGAYTLVDVTSAGVRGNGTSTDASFSSDGARVVFTSFATNLAAADTDASADVYVKTLAGGALQLVSTTATGVKANGASVLGEFSPDGTKVAFLTTATNLGYANASGRLELVVKDLASGAVTLASVDPTGLAGNGDTTSFAWSPDGQKLTFSSGANNLVAGDANASPDVFVRDLVSGTTTLMSPGANGASTQPQFGTDSATVVFASAASNLPGDTNGATSDIYSSKLTAPAGPSTAGVSAQVNVTAGAGAVPLEAAATVADGSGVVSRVVVTVTGEAAGDHVAYTATAGFALTSDITGGGTETLTFDAVANGGASTADAQALLRSLSFGTAGAAGARGVSISLADPTHAIGSTAAVSTVLQVAAAPGAAGPVVIAGTGAQTVSDATVASPFAGLTLSGVASTAYVTATVTLSTSANGALGNTGAGALAANGTAYTLSGSEAGVQAALRALTFAPTLHETTAGLSETTGFTLTVTPAGGVATTDAHASVVVIASNTAPTITDLSSQVSTSASTSLVAGQVVGLPNALQPFHYTFLADPDPGATETVSITFAQNGAGTDAVGVLSGAGLTRTGAGTYTLAAAGVAQATAALQALVLTPVPAVAQAGASFDLTLSVSDGIAAPTVKTSTLQFANTPGGSTYDTNSSSASTVYRDTAATAASHAYATEILAVLDGGKVVYDQTFNAPYSDAQVQAAVAQARAALTNAGATTASASILTSTGDSFSTATTTTQTGTTQASAVTVNQTFGPSFIGPNVNSATGGAPVNGYRGYLDVLGGALDINTDINTATYVARTVTTTTTDLTAQQYVLSGSTSTAMPATTTLVSTNAQGVEGNSVSQTIGITEGVTADGVSVLFGSSASNLTANYTANNGLYLKNTVTGAITAVGTNAAGLVPDGTIDSASVSGDGGTVVLATAADNIDPTANTRGERVYIHNVAANTLTLLAPTSYVITSAATGAIESGALFTSLDKPTLSNTGQYIAASYTAGSGYGILLFNQTTHTAIDVLSTGGTLQAYSPVISQDASTLVFASEKAPPNPGPDGYVPPANGFAQIYAYSLSSHSFQIVSQLVGANTPSVEANAASLTPTISNTGSRVGFVSSATNLDDRATDGSANVYVSDLASGRLFLVDVTADGSTKANAAATSESISGDGTMVVFQSAATNLVAGVTDGQSHIYLKNLTTGAISLVDLTPSGVPGYSYQPGFGGDATNPVFAPDSTHIVFSSNANTLAGNDTNNATDVFLATLGAPPASTSPTITGVPMTETDPGRAAIQPFTAAVVNGTDTGQTYTLSLEANQKGTQQPGGTFSGGGFTAVGSDGATFSATSLAAIQAALRAVSFTPNSADTALVYNLSYTGGSAAYSVEILAPAGAPAATGATSSVAYTFNAAAVTLEPNIVLSDTSGQQLSGLVVAFDGNRNDTLTVSDGGAAVSLATAGAHTVGRFTETTTVTATDIYLQFSGPSTLTTADYQALLRTLAYSASSTQGVYVPGTEGVRIVLVDPTHAAPATTFTVNGYSDAATTINLSSPPASNTPPTLGGTAGGQAATDKGTASPFANVTVTDPDSGQSETVTVSYAAANGTLAGAGFTASAGSATGSFASAAAAQAALRALVFTPMANQVTPGSTVTTGFSVSVSDGAATATDATTTVVTASVNDAPTLGGIAASQAATAGTATTPFAAAVIADPDTGQTETVTVAFAAGAGTFAGAGFTGSGGTFTGTFASAAAAQAALRAVSFTPTAGAAASDALTVTVQDAPNGAAAAVSASTTLAVGFAAPNTPPTIGGAAPNQTDAAGVAITPFATITVTDPDAGQSETVTVGFAAGSGSFSGAGFTGSGGSYTGTFASAAAAQAALRAASFTPAAGANSTTVLTLTVSDGQATATNGATSVVATYTPSTTPTTTSSPLSVTSGFLAEAQNLFRALAAGADALNPSSPIAAQFRAEATLAAQLDAGQLTLPQAESALDHLADGTTGVAVSTYAFFTGQTPTAAGLTYLVHSPVNGTDLNDPYYARFSTENRFINFAVNLATGPGAGAAAFAASYGALSLADATAKAYMAVFGATADAAKVAALLNTLVPDGLGGQETRATYFAQYGGDGANGQGTKAAMIGFLLSQAVQTSSGVYGTATEHYLSAIAHGAAPALGSELALHYGPDPGLVGTVPTLDGAILG